MKTILPLMVLSSALVGSLHAEPIPPQEPLAGGVYTLWNRAVQDEDGWFTPPQRNRKKIGEHPPVKKEVRMRKVEREVPVYAYTTKEVMVRTQGNSAGAQGTLQKKTVKVRGKQIGTKTETRLVSDPKGPIRRTQTIRRPIYGPGGTDRWQLGRVGTNALQAAVLQRTGIEESQEDINIVTENLVELVEGYGLPDLTWDLVWMIVLFSESDHHQAQEYVPDMVEKLMRAQWTDGSGAGLWGPIAIQPEYLAYLYQRFWQASERFSSVKADVGEDQSPAALKKISNEVAELDAVKEELNHYTWFYEKANPVDTSISLTDPWEEKRSFGLPSEYPFHTRTADLESTWLALIAIRAAADRNLIQTPGPTSPPQPGRLQRPPAPNPKRVVVRAGMGVMRQQHSSGAFTEGNHHAATRAFQQVQGIRGIPLQSNASFPSLPSPVTLTSTAQGLACLSIIGDILGPSAYRQYGRSMLGAKQILDSKIQELSAGNTEHLGKHSMGKLGFALALMDSGPEMESAPQDLRAEALSIVLAEKSKDRNAWGTGKTATFLPTVWKAQARVLPQRTKGHEGFDEPFVWRKLDPKKTQNFHKFHQQKNTRMDSGVLTALAVWILSGGEPVEAEVPSPTPPAPEAEEDVPEMTKLR